MLKRFSTQWLLVMIPVRIVGIVIARQLETYVPHLAVSVSWSFVLTDVIGIARMIRDHRRAP